MSTARERAATLIAHHVSELGLVTEQPEPFTFVVSLPGEQKLQTTTALVVGDHSLAINAFVIRAPEDNVAAVHQWLLERNRRLTLVAYAVDQLGDIYLSGRIPLAAVSDEVLDAVLGQVLAASDDTFNLLLELGFESAIRREWQWRLDRGEPTANLAAFEHLRPQD